MELGPLAQDYLPRALATVAMAGLTYILPSVIAWHRHHHNAMAIVAVNLLLGWTVLGWLGAFIWSLTSPPRRD